jgi:hypothetical protein
MNRCNYCGGRMQIVPPSHPNEPPEFTDDDGNGWNRSCMLCGRNNRPPVSIDELAVRRRRLDLNAHGTTLPHRTNTPRNRARAAKDADYRRCLDIVRDLTEPFTTRDIAERMGEDSMMVAAWLRRAQDYGWIRNAGRQLVRSDDARHPSKVATWETIHEERKATG